MGQWYNGYRFAKTAETDLYNTDMVLYYLKDSIPNRGVPDYLIDTNVRIDYGKLRHLLVVGRQLNGNFDLLRDVIGEEQVDTDIRPGFPQHELAEPENFLSLLHYFGLLSIRDVQGVTPTLAIPNQTVRRLMYGYLRDGYKDVGVFRINLFRFEQLMLRMANEGEWRPVLEYLSEAIAAQTGIRDYIAGEKVVQGFLAAYLSVANYYVFRSEAELGKGHADIALEPLVARYPQLRHGYLIELKYLSRSESAESGRVTASAGEATAQLQRYLADEAAGTAVPGGAVHRLGGSVSRLGDGVLRRGGVAWRISVPGHGNIGISLLREKQPGAVRRPGDRGGTEPAARTADGHPRADRGGGADPRPGGAGVRCRLPLRGRLLP